MAWRIHENLMAGELDNATPGRVTGTLAFIGKAGTVHLTLTGDMLGELRGRRIRLHNPLPQERAITLGKRGSYMRRFGSRQTGQVHSIAILGGGLLHAVWFDDTNGRVVLELPAAAWSFAD